MKHILTFLCALLFSAAALATSHTLTVKVTNTWKHAKHDEPVVVDLHAIKRLHFAVASATVTLQGKEIPCQLDDMDGDTKNDELVFLTDIEANSTNQYIVALHDGDTQHEYPSRVWGALVLRDKKELHPLLTSVEAPGASNLFNDIHMHGSVMESELVGWRVYFDKRQNLDLYGKKHRRIEIPETEFYTTAEQLQQGYGVDVLWAGNAIGCGTFRGWNNDPTLIDNVKVRGQRLIANGPLRTVVEVKDLGWRVHSNNDKLLNMRQLYIQYAGHRDLEIKVMFDDSPTDILFCTGVQKVGVTASDTVRHGHTPTGFLRDGIAASWGCDYPDMGKKQLWQPEAIGLATYVPTHFIEQQQESDLNYLYILSLGKERTLTYRTAFCADKEADGFHTAEEWFEWVQQWKESIENQTIITLKQ